MSDRPLRSVLFVPAANARAIDKVATLACDGVIVDLEDSVAPEAKPTARTAACAALVDGRFGDRVTAIRINPAGTTWHEADIAAACAAAPDAIVLPKVEHAQDVRAAGAALDRHGAPDRTKLWAMIETPAGVLAAADVAAASRRLTTLVAGTNDLAVGLRAAVLPGRAPLAPALALVVLVARAHGVRVLDGVFTDIADQTGFLTECRQGREWGFDGKTLIHPTQIDGANRMFAPTPREVEDARGLLAAWDARGDSGVATFDGRMIEALHAEAARRTLAADRALAARDETPGS